MTAHRARPGLPLAHAGAGPARTAPAGAAAAAAAGRAGGSTPASPARPSAAAAAAPAASGRAMAACMELLPDHTLMHCIHTVLAGCSARVAPPAPPARPAGSPPSDPLTRWQLARPPLPPGATSRDGRPGQLARCPHRTGIRPGRYRLRLVRAYFGAVMVLGRFLRMPLSRRLLTAPARFCAVLARGRAANSTANKTTASKTTAAVAAFGVFMASVIVAVAFGGGNGPTPPVQRWGSAAGRPHRVPASATMARLVNGRVVYPAASRGSAGHVTAATELPPSRRPRGAVPATPPVPRLRLPERGTGRPEQVRPARQPAAPTVGGFDRSTSRAVPKNSSADTTAYQNADG